jgi:hypothetical protein
MCSMHTSAPPQVLGRHGGMAAADRMKVLAQQYSAPGSPDYGACLPDTWAWRNRNLPTIPIGNK